MGEQKMSSSSMPIESPIGMVVRMRANLADATFGRSATDTGVSASTFLTEGPSATAGAAPKEQASDRTAKPGYRM